MQLKSPPLLNALLFVIVWVFLVVLFAAQLRYGGAEWSDSLPMSLLQWLPWIVFSPMIIWLSKQMPLPHRSWIKHLSTHAITCLTMLYLTQFFPLWQQQENQLSSTVEAPHLNDINTHLPPFGPDNHSYQEPGLPPHNNLPPPNIPPHHFPAPITPPPPAPALITMVSQTAPIGIPAYAAIVFLTSLLGYQKDLREREKAAHLLEHNLAEAKLELLRSQLQPHFLFNTLNSISTLIHSAPDKADNMVIQLSDLLRTTLDQRNQEFITVRTEIKMLENYLNIQSARFRKRLSVSYHIDPATEQLEIPPMILLPLVENAIAYAVEKSSSPTLITITVKLIDNTIQASVSDNGAGLALSKAGGTGVGLANIRSRLKMLYPKGSTNLTLTDNNGVTATLSLPINHPSV